YVSGTPDGKRPARWRINASVEPPQPKAPLEGTSFHETIPGHHLQIAIAQEREKAHPITRYLFSSGFGEGWALYAERLAGEMGLGEKLHGREVHDHVLEDGSVPLPVLRDHIEAWLAGKR